VRQGWERGMRRGGGRTYRGWIFASGPSCVLAWLADVRFVDLAMGKPGLWLVLTELLHNVDSSGNLHGSARCFRVEWLGQRARDVHVV